ncbi:PD-(D/E)XK nuclease domain-containing protein [bacterium 210820-DFI.6.37]|nr:PD-(D/E)XK nuclease domain-containing protein [bacterium 210820-DFI.6.37]
MFINLRKIYGIFCSLPVICGLYSRDLKAIPYILLCVSQIERCVVFSVTQLGNGSKKAVIVIEVKRTVSFTQMEQVCNQALRQIEDRQYAAEFLREGYHKVLKYGICFCKKSCIVKLGK